jgi:hypothetical protein
MRQRSLYLPSVIFTFLLATLLSTAAHAGHWAVIYDLAPNSGLETTNPGGIYNDPITGNLSFVYDAATSGAPLSNPRLVNPSKIDGSISQDAGILKVTGTNMNVLDPGPGGTPGVLSGAVLNLAVVADHDLDGYLHCTEASGGVGGNCDIFFGTPNSNNIPQTATGPFEIPDLNFAATAGVGDFTSDTSTMTTLMGVVTKATYRGKEIYRTYNVPEPTGLAMLASGALLLAGLHAARRSSKR